jgi:hypothetical protein
MMMRNFLMAGLVVALCFTSAAPLAFAQSGPAYNRLAPVNTPAAPSLSCQATKLFQCGASGCEVEDHPTGLPVQITLNTARGRGEVCTYTFCSSFTLMGWRGRPQATGLVWAAQSGSNPPADRTPSYSYVLSISEDWQTFTLTSPGNGGVSGYSGACKKS